jgi:hypothetical protein
MNDNIPGLWFVEGLVFLAGLLQVLLGVPIGRVFNFLVLLFAVNGIQALHSLALFHQFLEVRFHRIKSRAFKLTGAPFGNPVENDANDVILQELLTVIEFGRNARQLLVINSQQVVEVISTGLRQNQRIQAACLASAFIEAM